MAEVLSAICPAAWTARAEPSASASRRRDCVSGRCKHAAKLVARFAGPGLELRRRRPPAQHGIDSVEQGPPHGVVTKPAGALARQQVERGATRIRLVQHRCQRRTGVGQARHRLLVAGGSIRRQSRQRRADARQLGDVALVQPVMLLHAAGQHQQRRGERKQDQAGAHQQGQSLPRPLPVQVVRHLLAYPTGAFASCRSLQECRTLDQLPQAENGPRLGPAPE
jgi:hypothetical protein